MKKILAVLISFLTIGLSSCGSSKDAEVNLNFPYSCKAEINHEDKSYLLELTRDENATWKTVFILPETICDLSITSFGESCTMDFNELQFTADKNKFPATSIASLLTSSLDHATSSSDAKCTERRGIKTVTGSIDDINYILTIEDDCIEKLEISDKDFVAEFSEFEK